MSRKERLLDFITDVESEHSYLLEDHDLVYAFDRKSPPRFIAAYADDINQEFRFEGYETFEALEEALNTTDEGDLLAFEQFITAIDLETNKRLVTSRKVTVAYKL